MPYETKGRDDSRIVTAFRSYCEDIDWSAGLSIDSSFCSSPGGGFIGERTGSINVGALVHAYAQTIDHLAANPGCYQCECNTGKREHQSQTGRHKVGISTPKKP